MKKNGFTLTEMIAVIVIIGVIMLVSIPVVAIMINNNNKDKYMFYVETIEKAIYAYGDLEFAKNIVDAHGNLTSATIKLDEDLIKNDYLRKFSDSDVSIDYTKKFYIKKEAGKVTIVNSLGNPEEPKLTFTKNGTSLTCTKSQCGI